MLQQLVTTMIFVFALLIALMKLVSIANCDQLVLNDIEYLTWTILRNLINNYLMIYVVLRYQYAVNEIHILNFRYNVTIIIIYKYCYKSSYTFASLAIITSNSVE